MPFKDKKVHREYQREYQRKWRIKNREKYLSIRNKHEQSKKRKEYLKKWWKESPKAKAIRKRFNSSQKAKEYNIKWNKENKEKIRIKEKKYNATDKGILNQIKKVENRRIKFKKIAGVYYNIPNKDLINIVNERDKVCVYCDCNFSNDKTSIKYRSYDHINAFKPHSINNTVKCCISCNSSKGDKDVLVWLKEKGLKPTELIYKLINNS